MFVCSSLLVLVFLQTCDSYLICRETCNIVVRMGCGGGSGGASLIRTPKSWSRRFLVLPTRTFIVFFFLFIVFSFFLYVGDFLTVYMIRLYMYTTPACAIASGQESFLVVLRVSNRLGYYGESALVVGNRFNSVILYVRPAKSKSSMCPTLTAMHI